VADLSLSVVIPAYNEASHLPATIEALIETVERSGFAADIVLVDDGSTDGTAAVASVAVDGRIPFEVLKQANRGRLQARRAGLAAANGEFVLLLDARVTLLPDALAFVRRRLEKGETVWNGHVHVAADDALGTFWRLLAELAWRDYFDDPRTTSFGEEDFDRYPKGTTCFLAPRRTLEDAFEKFTTRYEDPRLANDDTTILRHLAREHRINISPGFACVYAPRTDAAQFFRHAVHRGIVFLDGHASRESRFFPAVVAFFPASAGLLLASRRRPVLLPMAALACGVAAASYGVIAGRSRPEIKALLQVTPLYGVGHALGMWKGLGELVRGRLRQ
jgi:glycosyltransferase involved in cell wall biosynthesis